MTAPALPAAGRRFVDYFGELGPRWGLPGEACRVHALLYVEARPLSEDTIAGALALTAEQLTHALAFLADYRMAERTADARWRSSTDPWEMLVRGLEQRGRRELPPAIETLRACREEARTDPNAPRAITLQIGKMLALAEDLAAIDAQAARVSPRMMRRLVGVSGRAARFASRTFGPRKDRS